ncbi:cell division protein FtsX [Tindallia magadiensis]|uniref:Cell division protein FtsX n=1 Tax=Tindallia magadiensis TaxID=69895 RepID=A0A1I3F828_9FIRM|nr:permease-like cell division protein FtsX [Tindallia magadiensis]SFI07374.1 cell division protein FtsX [Tindallia magadiensis]
MKLRSFQYILQQSFKGIWRNKGMGVASISSVAASLTILGLMMILVLNMGHLASLAQTQFDSMQVYLEDDLSSQEIDVLGSRIGDIQGVSYVHYESKEMALANMKERWGEQGHLLDSLDNNPLPNSYIVHVHHIRYSDAVVNEIDRLTGVDEIRYYRDIIDNLIRIAGLVRTVGLIVMTVLILIATFIISNTIKLTINARKREIRIMKDVGATNWFIRWPFLLEGTILGLVGAMIAVVIVYFGYQTIFDMVTTRFFVMFSTYLLSVEEMMQRTVIMFAVLGSGVGALGSIISLRKHLEI